MSGYTTHNHHYEEVPHHYEEVPHHYEEVPLAGGIGTDSFISPWGEIH